MLLISPLEFLVSSTSVDVDELRVAEEAVLALVDFPKQIVVALSMAVRYMTGAWRVA
jgi:hypothetical protein